MEDGRECPLKQTRNGNVQHFRRLSLAMGGRGEWLPKKSPKESQVSHVNYTVQQNGRPSGDAADKLPRCDYLWTVPEEGAGSILQILFVAVSVAVVSVSVSFNCI